MSFLTAPDDGLPGHPNGSTTADAARIDWDCRFCGRPLIGFAIMTQCALGPLDGIDYCKKCAPRAAREHLGIPEPAGAP